MCFLFRYLIKRLQMSYSIPHRIALGPGRESVWDYPRLPRVERIFQISFKRKIILLRVERYSKVLYN